MMIRTLCFSVALGLALVAGSQAQTKGDLAGKYLVKGENPGGRGEYRGRAAIRQSGGTYQIVWQIGQSQYVGTGIRLDDNLAVVYASENQPAGVVHYRIEPDGSLMGLWTSIGDSAVGTETWTPEGRL